MQAFVNGQPLRKRLKELLRKKEIIGELCDQLRAGRSRALNGRGSPAAPFLDDGALAAQLSELLLVMERLDEEIGPLVEQDGEHFSPRWGYLSITGFTLASAPTLLQRVFARVGLRRLPLPPLVACMFSAHVATWWGVHAGVNDKSQLQRQIEKYADIYTSRVSNLLRYTPYCYFRSKGQSLTHYRRDQDPACMGGDSCENLAVADLDTLPQ